ncbi:MAG: hypothetical protein SGPRY_006869 [Prymnesium sp.]
MLQRPLSPVLLTREQGKNDKLGALLSAAGVPHEELPCISFERLQGCSELEASLQQGGFDWCIITSPESASVFLDSWKASGSPAVRIASVGAGTAQVLESAGLESDFVPSKATGKMLAAELPVDSDGKHVALYPASAIASSNIEDGLQARGVVTHRINTQVVNRTILTQPGLEIPLYLMGSCCSVRVWAERAGTSAVAVRHFCR